MPELEVEPKLGAYKYSIRFGFKATNNEAKYELMITGLRLAHTLRAINVKFNSNSPLVVG